MNFQNKKPLTSGFLQSVNLMYDRAINLLDLPEDVAQSIRACNSTYEVQFSVRLRGKLHNFKGYRSVHSEHMEPVKGGIRYAMAVNQDEVEALAVDEQHLQAVRHIVIDVYISAELQNLWQITCNFNGILKDKFRRVHCQRGVYRISVQSCWHRM